jgi:hypothetical protein
LSVVSGQLFVDSGRFARAEDWSEQPKARGPDAEGNRRVNPKSQIQEFQIQNPKFPQLLAPAVNPKSKI